MSQNELAIQTTGTLSGLGLVEDINAALDTVNTLSSGASAPANPEAGQLWHDTTSNTLWLRNLANTGWIALFGLDEANNLAITPGVGIHGLTLSNGSGTSFGIAAGAALADSADAVIEIAAAVTKTLGAFAAGSTNGALDTGTVANNSWYHVYAIRNPTTGAVDVLASTSAATPSLPSGFTKKVRLGAVYVGSSGSIAPFTQIGNDFLFATGFQDVGYTGVSTTTILKTLTVPGGIKVRASFRAAINNGAGGVLGILFQSPDEAAESIGVGSSPGNCSLQAQLSSGLAAGEFAVRTNTSSQINVTANSSSGSAAYSIYTTGFTYPRGLI